MRESAYSSIINEEKKMKRFVCLILCLIMVTSALVSCTRIPDISEIRDRLYELIEASYEVNPLLFGEGPKTYERIYDPKADIKYYENAGQKYYYFYVKDDEVGNILAYRTKSYGDDYNFLLVTDKADAAEAEKLVYTNTEDGLYYFSIEYEMKDAEFYYDSSLPKDYDVIRLDEKFNSIATIKEAAENVYSKSYLDSIYETLFTGVMISGDTSSGLLTARYVEYEDSEGSIWFMKSNTYEPLTSEKRVFDVSTATIARGSKAKRLRIEMDSYLESKPNEKMTVTINLALENGVWYLDSGTY